MGGRIFRTLIGAAMFLAGYAMQEGGISPFEGMHDPRFLGLLLEGLGLLFLLTPLLRRRKLPPAKYPRIRREYLKPPCCGGEDEDVPDEPEDPDKPENPDKPDGRQP